MESWTTHILQHAWEYIPRKFNWLSLRSANTDYHPCTEEWMIKSEKNVGILNELDSFTIIIILFMYFSPSGNILIYSPCLRSPTEAGTEMKWNELQQ